MYPTANTKASLLLFLALLLPLQIPAVLHAMTGLEIMRKEDDRDRGRDMTSKSVFTLINKRGQKRIRNTTYYWKDYKGKDGYDEKTFIFFNAPPEVEGTGFLNWSYSEIAKDDDQWLYLPALRKIKRISGSDTEDSFMGTDFTFDDMGDRQVEEDVHTLLRKETYQDNECFVVQSVPKEKNYIYSNKIVWVDAGEWIPYRVEFYDRKARLLKTLLFTWKKVQGIWVSALLDMANVQTGHRTTIEVSDISINVGLEDTFFSKRTLRRKGH